MNRKKLSILPLLMVQDEQFSVTGARCTLYLMCIAYCVTLGYIPAWHAFTCIIGLAITKQIIYFRYKNNLHVCTERRVVYVLVC